MQLRMPLDKSRRTVFVHKRLLSMLALRFRSNGFPALRVMTGRSRVRQLNREGAATEMFTSFSGRASVMGA